MLDDPQIAQLGTVAGNAIITALLCELFWRTTAASSATKDRFGPIVAVGFGVGLAIVAVVVLTTTGIGRVDVAQAALTGLVGGFAAIGVHDVVNTKAGTTG